MTFLAFRCFRFFVFLFYDNRCMLQLRLDGPPVVGRSPVKKPTISAICKTVFMRSLGMELFRRYHIFFWS